MVARPTFNELKNKEIPLKIRFIKINNMDVEIKQYLPVNEKLNLITRVLEQVAQNDYPFANPVQMDVYTALEILYAYTNIDFSEEEKANPAELYDELEKQGIINMVINAIPEVEYNFLVEGIEETVKAYYSYRNSIKGIIADTVTDYSDLELDAEKIRKDLADPDNMALLKDVLKKLG